MKKRFFSALIAAVMLLAMVPAFGLVSAEEVIVWPELGADITISGKVYTYMGETDGGLEIGASGGENPVVFSVGDGYILWDDVSALTLHNATLTETIINGNMTKVLDLAAGTLTLEGKNKIEAGGETEYFCGLYIDGVYTIKGPGSLDIDLSHTADPSNTDRYYDGRGIVNSEELLIEGAKISVSIKSENVDSTRAVSANSSLTLRDAKLICNAEGDGYTAGLYVGDDLIATDSTILGSSVSSTEAEEYIDFIESYGNISLTKTVVKGALDASVKGYGLYADYDILLDQSALILTYPGTYQNINSSIGSLNVTVKESYVNVGGSVMTYTDFSSGTSGVLTLRDAVILRPFGAHLQETDESWDISDYIAADEQSDSVYATDIMLAPKAFSDVPSGAWFAPAAGFNDAMGLFEGTSATTFAPNMQMTRAMMMVALARVSGVDTTPAAGQSWYEKGRQWAMANGVSDGTNPNNVVTREQLAKMIWNLEGSPAADVSVLNGFADGASTSSWAKEGLAWAVENGIINGKDGNRLDPVATATRAEVAQLMMNYLTVC